MCLCAGLLTFAGLPVWLQHEAHGAAAVHPGRCVVALTVAASVVDGTGLCEGGVGSGGVMAEKNATQVAGPEGRPRPPARHRAGVQQKPWAPASPSSQGPALTSAAKRSTSLPPT